MKNTAEYLTKKIEDLGYSLIVKHYRYDKRISFRSQRYKRFSPVSVLHPQTLNNSEFASHGGCTVATIYDSKGWTVCAAKAVCSTKDNFNKKIGWIKAVGRAYGVIPTVYHVPSKSRETIVVNK